MASGRQKQRPRVFLTGKLPDSAVGILRRRYDLDVYDGPLPVPRRRLLAGLRDAAGLVCYPFDRIDAAAIDSAPNLKTISTCSVGFDHIDMEAARSRGISVGYTPEVLTEATADLAMALMLDLLRRVTEGDRMIRGGRWRRVHGPVEYTGSDMRHKTLGILGMGRIGGAVARRAAAFGMKITYHSRSRLPEDAEAMLGGAIYVPLGRLVSKSDVISIHVPYNEGTHHMLDAKAFARMKRSAFVINTSRGKVIRESDLVDALRRGQIAGAGLDVFESEPVRRSNPLVGMQNVVMAPHIGSSTAETRSVMADITARNLDLGIRGRPLVYSVR